MNTTNRLWHVGAAVGLALFAVLLTTFYVTSYKHHVQHGQSQVTVLVATKDIPADTPGSEILAHSWLQKQSVARRQVVPGAISSPEQIRSLIATEPVFAGEQVTARRFGTPAERGVRAQINGTQRAIEVAGDAHQLLAGTLRSGDHVDVVGAWEINGGASGDARLSRVVLRDILVLLAPTTAKASSGIAPSSGYSAQLRFSDSQSQKFEWLVANGKDWRLEIRPSADSANSPRSYDDSKTLLKDGVGNR